MQHLAVAAVESPGRPQVGDAAIDLEPTDTPDPGGALLQIRDLEVTFSTEEGKVTAVRGVDLEVGLKAEAPRRPGLISRLRGRSGGGE